MAGKQKILIVDDKRKNLFVLRQVLSGLDADIIEATSGNQALTMTLDHSFAVAILDVMMPGMTGYELAEHLRGDKATRGIPIILLTASYEGEQHVFKGYEAGCVDFIVKPYNPEALIGKVRIFLELDQTKRELVEHRDHLEALVTARTRDLIQANENQQLEIAERKRLGEQLRASEAKMRGIVDNIGIGIALVDKDHRLLEVNRSIRTWFPDTAPEKAPVCYHMFNDPPREEPCKNCPTRLTFQDGRVHETTLKRSQSNGMRSYRILSSPIHGEQGGITHAIIMVEDVTERLSLEEQLLQAQKLEAIGQLAGGVAHDFNNMLGIIIGYGEILLEKMSPSDPLKESAGEILMAGQRSAALTRQLLAFSRKQTLQVELLNVNRTVRNLEKMLGRLIGEDIELRTRLSEDLAYVTADPVQLEQVIMNLAVNARDAMPQGGKLAIETENDEFDETDAGKHSDVTPGKYVLLSVTDSGCGMDETTRKKIFEPFFTTKKKGEGTGLGLSTVYGIVKQLGGHIWVYSELGRGTVFKIYLPRTESLEAPTMPAEQESVAAGDMNILVVEDEKSLQEIICSMLQSLGYQVTTTAGANEALFLIEKRRMRPDLLITDVVMPDMSGKVLVDRLKKVLPELKVLYMSGYTDSTIVNYGILDSGTPFIQKPFGKRKLADKIASLLWKPQS